MHLAFLDESGDHSLDKIDQSYPIFVLCAVVFDETYYYNTVVQAIKNFKLEHSINPQTPLHSYHIRKQKPPFNFLYSKDVFNHFAHDITDLLINLDFQIYAVTINKNNLTNSRSTDNPYHYCFHGLLKLLDPKITNNFMLRIESREPHNDRKLTTEFAKYKEFSPNTQCQDISFHQKDQVIAGLEIADLCAYPIGRHTLHPTASNLSFNVIAQKMVKFGNWLQNA
jgi:hypothetical protein